MPATTSTNITYLVLAAIMLGAVVFSFTVVSPAITDITNVRTEISSREDELARRENFLQTLDQKARELQLQAQHEGQLNVILPTDERFEDALRIIGQSVNQSGIIATEVLNRSNALAGQVRASRARGENVSTPAGADVLGASISFGGSYQQFRAFLRNLERSPRLMNVTDFSINASQSEPDQLSGDMTVLFYSHKGEGN